VPAQQRRNVQNGEIRSTSESSGGRQKAAPVTKRRFDAWRVLTALSLCACLVIVVSLLARYWWVFELATHFQAQYAGALTFATIAFLAGQKWKQSALCAVFLAMNVWAIVPLYGKPLGTPTANRPLRMVAANIYRQNREHDRFLDLVDREEPDIVLVIEVDVRWVDALDELTQTYPYSKSVPRDDSFGVAIYSKLPLVDISMQAMDEWELPVVVATLAHEDQTFTIIGAHTLPPRNSVLAAGRNQQLLGLADLARETDGPLLLAGDLNVSSWSPYFDDLTRKSRLRDSRVGFGIQPTWSSGFWLMGIPIDHVLVSSEVTVRDRRIGNDVGSDHLPVIIDFEIAP